MIPMLSPPPGITAKELRQGPITEWGDNIKEEAVSEPPLSSISSTPPLSPDQARDGNEDHTGEHPGQPWVRYRGGPTRIYIQMLDHQWIVAPYLRFGMVGGQPTV